MCRSKRRSRRLFRARIEILKNLIGRLKELNRDLVALTIAVRDPACPRAAKLLAAVVMGYALSPVDLIPDFIPILGVLDDLILVPVGIYLVERMVPKEVMDKARERAIEESVAKRSTLGLILVLATWILILAGSYILFRIVRGHQK